MKHRLARHGSQESIQGSKPRHGQDPSGPCMTRRPEPSTGLTFGEVLSFVFVFWHGWNHRRVPCPSHSRAPTSFKFTVFYYF